jgi:hypothetical protein
LIEIVLLYLVGEQHYQERLVVLIFDYVRDSRSWYCHWELLAAEQAAFEVVADIDVAIVVSLQHCYVP